MDDAPVVTQVHSTPTIHISIHMWASYAAHVILDPNGLISHFYPLVD